MTENFSCTIQPYNTTLINPCGDDNTLQVPLAVGYSIIFVLGLVGNLVALWVFFCVHSKKNSVRLFLINVALADLLLVVCLPFRILYHSQGDKWKLDPTLCKIVGNVFYMNMYISITLLGLISVDRYFKLHRSAGMRHKMCSSKFSFALCAIIWITAISVGSVIMVSKNHSAVERCFHYKKLDNEKWKAYINMCVVVLFWLVFMSLIVSYGKIALKLLRTSQANPDLPNATHYARTSKKSFFILFLFCVCFVPYHMVRVFYIKTQITDTSYFWMCVADKTNEVALLFSALNSCLDPVMYFLLSSSVRKEVLRLVNSVFCARDVAGISGSSSIADLDVRNGRSDQGQPNTSLITNIKEVGSSF